MNQIYDLDDEYDSNGKFKGNSFTHTLEEIIILFVIICTLGFIYFIAKKKDTSKSVIHPFLNILIIL